MGGHLPTLEQYTVAVVFAMGFEMTAFRAMLDEEYDATVPQDDQDSNDYILGRLGQHNVVLAWLPGTQGIGAAAAVGKDLARTFRFVRWRFLVGVGGGFPSEKNDIRLGDVVVSMPDRGKAHGGVVQYDLGKDTGDDFCRKGFLTQPPPMLRNKVIRMQSNHELWGGSRLDEHIQAITRKYPALRQRYNRPNAASDVLFEDNTPHQQGNACENCDPTHVKDRKLRADDLPVIHYGLIASGNRVVVSAEERQKIKRSVDGDILCFEMEAGGLAIDYACMVIRGISDYADAHKNKEWQNYAAVNAAACAKELLMLVRPAEVDALNTSHEPSRARSAVVYQHLGQGVQISGSGTTTMGDLNFGVPP
ncbi:phosphorylase superfamily protein [Sarocladium implicatum]|nr:phosphorylase superfamily protein [Sarocladium implicatum]